MLSFLFVSIASSQSLQGTSYIDRIQLEGSVNVLQCVFLCISSQTDGGALCIRATGSSSIEDVSISSTKFINCSTTATGGAVYISHGIKDFTLESSCVSGCFSTYTTHGVYSYSNTTVYDKVSVYRSAETEIASYGSSYILSSSFECEDLNSTYNSILNHGAFIFVENGLSNMKYINAVGTVSRGPLTAYAVQFITVDSLSYANNTQTWDAHLYMSQGSPGSFHNSVFLHNSRNTMINVGNILFSNCVFDIAPFVVHPSSTVIWNTVFTGSKHISLGVLCKVMTETFTANMLNRGALFDQLNLVIHAALFCFF